MASFDALLLLSFGGPEGPDDVMPFLRNVTRGRGIPEERLDEVAQHYLRLGGISPINAQNRALIRGARGRIRRERRRVCPSTGAIATGSRTSPTPCVRCATTTSSAPLVFATSATSSFSGCRQYRNDMKQARFVAGDGAPELTKLRHYFDHPGFIAANVDHVRQALATLPAQLRDEARLVFTAHSIPEAMNASSGPAADGLYAKEQWETARLVTAIVRGPGGVRSISCGSHDPVRRRCRGSSRTSTTT